MKMQLVLVVGVAFVKAVLVTALNKNTGKKFLI